MSVSHVSQDEPTRVDVWTVLKELPQRVQALLKHHEASQELGFEGLEQELHALCAFRRSRSPNPVPSRSPSPVKPITCRSEATRGFDYAVQ